MMRLSILTSVVCMGCALATWANAQKPANSPLQLNAEWRLRFEDRMCTDFCAPNHKHPEDELSRFRMNLTLRSSPNTTLFARLQHSYRRNRLNGTADTTEKSGFGQLYLDNRWGNTSLRLGRQEIVYGDNRVLAIAGWDNVGYTWDAVKLGFKGNRWQTDLFYGRPGMFPNSNTHPVLYGVYATYKPSAQWQSDLYLLRKEVIASGAPHRLWAVGVRPVVQLGKSAKLTAEAVVQTGQAGSKDLRAWGYWARLEYTLSRAGGTKLILQRDFASGGDPDGTTAHTFDQLFGTTFSQCGRMGLQGWRNMSTWRLGLSGNPSPRWQFTADVHFNRLADPKDYWYSSGGTPIKGKDGKALRDPTGSAGTEVGTEFNCTLTYSPARDLQLSAGYGVFLPGRFVRQTNGGFSDWTQWFYLQTTRKF
ncbi:MAG: alginate export family protein [Armatimonadota bacterium]|nr:alginate export family protein [Armatimonadota bacterium]